MQRIVIVSGANGHLGRAVVQKYLDNGDVVVGLVRNSSNLPIKPNLEWMESDLTDDKHCQNIVDTIICKYGRIDVAVLTAGGFAMGDLTSTKSHELNIQYKLNFETAYNVSRPVYLQMLEQDKGRIFLIGSKAGLDVSKAKSSIAYGLSKSLLFRLAELFNNQAKNKNIVTTVVVPSIINTPQNRTDMPDAAFDSWVTPDQIAANIFYYCSEEADALREPILKIYNRQG